MPRLQEILRPVAFFAISCWVVSILPGVELKFLETGARQYHVVLARLKDSASSSFVIAGTPVSYLLLGGLAESLDTNWIELGKILGFSKKNLQKVDRKNECLRDKGMAMLVGWKMRRGDDATVEVLQNALMELGMMDMLELDAGTNYYHDT